MQFHSFDETYLERLRSGDLQAQQHFSTYFSELIRLKLRRRLRSPAAIEDVCQETFVRVWMALRSEQGVRHPERLGAFVNAVCKNVLREHYREASKETPTGDEVGINLPDAAITVPDAIANRQTRQRVRHILTQLSERDRRLLAALFLDERDKEEVCRSLGVNRKYLRVLLWRAKRSFRALCLQETEKCGGEPSCGRSLNLQGGL